MPSDVRSLIINADDFGLTAGVNAGIIAAHHAGTVTAASIMVNTPGFADAVSHAASNPALDVGLHLNLTLGAPVAPPPHVRSLIDPATGKFLPLWRLAARAWAGRIRPADVQREMAAQWETARGAGLALSHLDGHQHTHLLPGIAGAVRRTASALGIRHLRVPWEPLRIHPTRWRSSAVKTALAMARVATRTPRHATVTHWRGLSLEGHPQFQQALVADLRHLPAGVTELMVHPGYVDETLAALDPYLTPRVHEVDALLSEAVRVAVHMPSLRLTTFRDL